MANIQKVKNILFLHAITGCDTTFALFNNGKSKALKILEKRDVLRNSAESFKIKGSLPQLIFTNGVRFLLAMYGASQNEKLIDTYRYYIVSQNQRSFLRQSNYLLFHQHPVLLNSICIGYTTKYKHGSGTILIPKTGDGKKRMIFWSQFHVYYQLLRTHC